MIKLLLLIIIALPAQAQTTRLRTIVLGGDEAINMRLAQRMHEVELPKFYRREFKHRIVPQSLHSGALPADSCRTLEGWQSYDCWRATRRAVNHHMAAQRLTLVILPGIGLHGRPAYAGLGTMGMPHNRGLAVAWCPKTAISRYRCFLVAAHELGHNFGLKHFDARPNFMHSAAGQWAHDWKWRPQVVKWNRGEFRMWNK